MLSCVCGVGGEMMTKAFWKPIFTCKILYMKNRPDEAMSKSREARSGVVVVVVILHTTTEIKVLLLSRTFFE